MQFKETKLEKRVDFHLSIITPCRFNFLILCILIKILHLVSYIIFLTSRDFYLKKAISHEINNNQIVFPFLNPSGAPCMLFINVSQSMCTNKKYCIRHFYLIIFIPRWYADILDKAADMLKVPIIYDINQQDSAGKTALHYAAHRGRVQAAQILINAGCQLDIASSDSCTPLHMACQSNSLETVNLLLESGARVDPRLYNKKTPLHLAAKRDRADFVEALIKKGAQIDAQDAQDRTPLSIAVMNEAASAVQVLLKYGAKVNFEDVHGKIYYEINF